MACWHLWADFPVSCADLKVMFQIRVRRPVLGSLKEGCVPPEDYLRLGPGLPQRKLDPWDTPSSSLPSSEITSGSRWNISVPLGTVRCADLCRNRFHSDPAPGVEAGVCAG